MCDIIFLPQITQISRLYSPSNVFLAHGMHGTHGILLFISHRLHRLKMIFTIRIQRFALLLRKNRSTNLHRFLPCGICFFNMKTREHDLFSLRLFSPTNYTNFTPLFSLKRLFSPRNARNTRNFIIYFPQITQIKMILPFGFNDSLFCCAKIALRICTDFCLAAFLFFFRHEDKRT